jgi:predicted DNA-binding antitoxin AbrB/MazE fold protein
MAIQVVYENGLLRPLKPLNFAEGAHLEIDVRLSPSQEMPSLAEIDDRLEKAGLRVWVEVPEDAQPLSIEERVKIGALFVGERPVESLIDEDRGD